MVFTPGCWLEILALAARIQQNSSDDWQLIAYMNVCGKNGTASILQKGHDTSMGTQINDNDNYDDLPALETPLRPYG